VTNSLAAMTGAMEGYTEGSKTKFDQNLKIWQTEADKIRESNSAANDRYKAILASNKLAMEEKLQEIQMTAAQFDDRAAMQLAQTQQLDTLGRLIEQRMSHQERMTEAGERLRQQFTLAKEKEEAQKELLRMRMGIGQEGSQSENIAKMIAEYRMAPYQGVAARSPQAAAIMNRVAELNPDYNATQYTSRSRAVTAFATGKEGQMVRSMNAVSLHLDTLDNYGKALATGNSNTINRWKQRFQEEFGRPAPTNFDAVKQIVAAEILKAVVPSGGGVTERDRAAENIIRSRSPAQMSGIISSYKEILGGQLQALRKEYEDTTGMRDFDKRLLPSVKKAFESVASEAGSGGGTEQQPPAQSTLERIKSKLPQGWTVEPVQ